MKTFVRVVGGLIALVLVVLVGAGLYFFLFFDANDVREQIASKVSAQTGREFAIEGDLSLTYFPWLGFTVGETRLGEDPAFGSDDFVRFESASARLRLLPLLIRQTIEIGSLQVDGLNVNLVRNQAGVDNWQSLLDAVAGDETAPAPAENGDGASFSTGSIGGIKITDAKVRFDDRQAGGVTTVSDMNLSTGSVAQGEPVQLDGSFNVSAAEPALDAAVEFGGTLDKTAETMSISKPRFTVSGSGIELGEGMRFGSLSLELAAPQLSLTGDDVSGQNVTLNIKAADGGEMLRAFNLELDLPDVSGSTSALRLDKPQMNFDATGKTDALRRANGKFRAGNLVINDFDKLAFGSPDLSITVSGAGLPDDTTIDLRASRLAVVNSAQTLNLKEYSLSVLGASATGSMKGKDIIDAPDLRGDVNLATFSLRDTLTKMGVELETADAQALTRFGGSANLRVRSNSLELTSMDFRLDDTRIGGTAGVSDIAKNAQEFDLSIDSIDLDRYLAPAVEGDGGGDNSADAIELPAETLRALNLDGKVSIGKLSVSGLNSTQVQVGVKAAGGKLRVHPSQAKLYGGAYSGDIRIDASGEVPVLSIDETVTNVDFGAMAENVVEGNPLRGQLTGGVKLTGRGHNTDAIRETLDGNASFEFIDGTIQGIDMLGAVQSLLSLASRQAPGGSPVGATKSTPFTRLAGNARVEKGVVSTDDLVAAVPLLRIAGNGSVDLSTRAVDFKVDGKIVEVADVEMDPKLRPLIGWNVPIYIGGTYDAPQLVKKESSVAAIAKQILKARAAGALGLGDGSLDDKDKALDDKKEDLKDKVDDKAKDLLKDLIGG